MKKRKKIRVVKLKSGVTKIVDNSPYKATVIKWHRGKKWALADTKEEHGTEYTGVIHLCGKDVWWFALNVNGVIKCIECLRKTPIKLVQAAKLAGVDFEEGEPIL